MKLSNKIHILGVVIGIAYYIVDALLDKLIVFHDLSYMQVLIFQVPLSELYERLLVTFVIFVFGFLIHGIFKEKNYYRDTGVLIPKLGEDPNLMVNLSNQLRTPLNAIHGFVELLDDPNIENKSKELYLNHIKSSSNFLLEMINNVTDITLIESGRMYMDKQPTEVNSLMHDLHEKYTAFIFEKGKSSLSLSLILAVGKRDLHLKTDGKRLKQILENMLLNSIDSADGGEIEFGYRVLDGQHIEFYVKDANDILSDNRLDEAMLESGLYSEKKTSIIDLLYLRLFVTNQLVTLIGGELKAESEKVLGTEFSFVFTVELPKTLELLNNPDIFEAEETITVKGREADSGKWSDKTILIAEDTESNYTLLYEMLKPTGIKMLWAHNGVEACNVALSNKDIDLILMDILMPEMDGYEATLKIKDALPGMPIVAQTAYHLDEQGYKDANYLFENILTKPIWFRDLMKTMEEILD